MNKKKLSLILITSLLSINIVGCSTEKKVDSNVQENNEQHNHNHNHDHSQHTFKEISGLDLQKIQSDDKEKDNYLIIDTRSSDEYKEGHLKYAINIPFKEFKNHIAELENFKNKSIILYCHGKNMSIEAANMLKEAGFTELTIAPGVNEYKEYQFVK